MQVSELKMDIAHLFNRIAPKYDFLNHFLSFGIDHYWRKKTIHQLHNISECEILDVACGTGDLSFEAMRQGARKVIGIDISAEMLKIAMQKKEKKYHSSNISFEEGDGSAIPFLEQSFDAVTVAFGIRNFLHVEQGLHEFFRVLKSNGTLLILEFSMPKNSFIAKAYKIYFHRFLPFIGGIISGDRQAYRYLPESVAAFPHGDAFMQLLYKVGFEQVKSIPLSFGIAQIYVAVKKA